MLSDINLTYIAHDFVANLVRYIYLFIYFFLRPRYSIPEG